MKESEILERCIKRQKIGWHCRRRIFHEGSCALLPKWWNLKARWEVWGYCGR